MKMFVVSSLRSDGWKDLIRQKQAYSLWEALKQVK